MNPPIFLHCFSIKLGRLTAALLHLDSPKKKVSISLPNSFYTAKTLTPGECLKAKKERKMEENGWDAMETSFEFKWLQVHAPDIYRERDGTEIHSFIHVIVE